MLTSPAGVLRTPPAGPFEIGKGPFPASDGSQKGAQQPSRIEKYEQEKEKADSKKKV